MSELELLLLDQTDNCTVYTIQFLSDDLNEFEKFVAKFQADGELNKDFRIIGNGGQQNTRTYDEDDTLKGYVLTLQRFVDPGVGYSWYEKSASDLYKVFTHLAW